MTSNRRWTTGQVAILLDAVREARSGTVRIRVPWEEVAARTGHSVSSCRDKVAQERVRAGNRLVRQLVGHEDEPMRKAPPGPSATSNLVAPVRAKVGFIDFTRPTSTFRFSVDAEIRSRIADQGVTAGLLGDPPAGRSALDKRCRGDADAYLRGSRSSFDKPARISLAGVSR